MTRSATAVMWAFAMGIFLLLMAQSQTYSKFDALDAKMELSCKQSVSIASGIPVKRAEDIYKEYVKDIVGWCEIDADKTGWYWDHNGKSYAVKFSGEKK